MAPRGFDFTDESYYLLNYLYWRDLTATVSFFGAYFELPFRMLGKAYRAFASSVSWRSWWRADFSVEKP